MIELPAVFTSSQAAAAGVSDRQLAKWRTNDEITVVARGIYLRHQIEADLDLLEIAIRAPDATLCLTSALARHGLVDDIPQAIDAALPRTQRQPRTVAPTRWHRFDTATFDVDRTTIDIGAETTIGLYGPRRSIIDAFRLRHLYGNDQAVTALRRWLKLRGSQPSDLLDIARAFPTTERPIRETIEILL